jgi:DNA polymerase III subunit epsilon
VTGAAPTTSLQGTLDELGTPLREVTFVVVDLETTGGSPATSAITEIGAVKVCGGHVLGEFATLVNPRTEIPPFIAVLTGITDAMVAAAPMLPAVLPAFLEFARGSVLVAHNAPFDLGFLRTASARLGLEWPGFTSVDTARLARRVLTRDESPDCRLATLARLFRTATEPCHRALADSRATVDVLHGLLERIGGLGVHSLEELQTFSTQVTDAQRRKRHLADGLPHAPGVYLFRDANGRVLYIGKSSDLRRRVRNYFVSSETRSRIAEMIGLAERVDVLRCAHALEAEVRELRLIAEHKPSYNRRSRFPERATFVKLTPERYPRLSLVRTVRDDGGTYLGPFGSARVAQRAVAALHETFRLRQCSGPLLPRRPRPACALAGMGRCGAPCEGRESAADYTQHAAGTAQAMLADPRPVVSAVQQRIRRLSTQHRYEEAAVHRDRLAAFVRAAARGQHLGALTAIPTLVAARPSGTGGWELIVVRWGRLVAAGVSSTGTAVRPFVTAMLATAETVTPGPGPTPCATAEESERLLIWLSRPGTRLVELDGTWASPAWGAGGLTAWLDGAYDTSAVGVLADTRGLRPMHRPARANLGVATFGVANSGVR